MQRFVRPGFLFSLAVHVGLLAGLLVLGMGSVPPRPPEAMTVEIVPASEAPPSEPQNQQDLVDGTILESKSTGSELDSAADKGSASAAQRPKGARPSLQQAQAKSKAQRNASLTAQSQAAAPTQPETEPQAMEPLLSPSTPTDQPQPHPKEAASKPDVSEMFAMPLALPGGRIGGGLDAPSNTPAKAPHDDIAAFRARVSACTRMPPGSAGHIDPDLKIAVRISFKRDGTLASTPQLLGASLSPDAATLLQAAIDALQNCQPFSELPPDKYRKWKTLELVVSPFPLADD